MDYRSDVALLRTDGVAHPQLHFPRAALPATAAQFAVAVPA